MISRQDKGRKCTEVRAHHIFSAYHSALTSDVKEKVEETEDATKAADGPRKGGEDDPPHAAGLQVAEPDHDVVRHDGAEEGQQDAAGDVVVGVHAGAEHEDQENRTDRGDSLGHQELGDQCGLSAVLDAVLGVVLALVGDLHGSAGAHRDVVLTGVRQDVGGGGLRVLGHGVFAFSETVQCGFKHSYI